MADRMTAGFNIYGDSSDAWGMFMLDHDFPTPKEREILETVPYRSGSYDFSMLNGKPTYEDREFSFVMLYDEADWQERSNYKAEVNQWLKGRMPSVMTTELYENYQFNNVKCVDTQFENLGYGWKITLQFRAHPEVTNILTGERVVI